MYRMTIDSFNNLLDLLSPTLQLNEKFARMCCGAPTTSKVMLLCTIHLIAGRSYHDIRHTACISKASFYCVIWQTLHAINHCAALETKLPSDDEII
jgi:hypothetical protein